MARKNNPKTRQKSADKSNNQAGGPTGISIEKRVASSKSKFLRSLRSKMGVVSLASRECNISRTTHYEWMKIDPAYRAKVAEINEHAIDFVESKMFEAINNGDRQLIQFFLSTRGKKRGYSNRLEVEQERRNTIQLNITQYEDEY